MPKITRKALNARFVETVFEPGYYLDGEGLYLQVARSKSKTAAGAEPIKTWVKRYTRAGVAREGGLGPLRTVSLSQARVLNKEWDRLLAQGIDPIEERKQKRLAERIAESRTRTFQTCGESYIRLHKAGWRNEKHAAQWTATLETYAYPAIGTLPVSAIDTAEIMRVLEPIWLTKTETATRVRQRMEAVLDWATAHKYRAGPNPARWKGHLDKLLPKRSKVAPVEHHRALPYKEMAAFWTELHAVEGIAARALELIILTATRTGEALNATWAEIDFAEKAWNIPAARTKTSKPHRVPLSTAALAILREMEASRLNEYVFPGQKLGEPLSNMACLAVLDRMERRDITVHGFRSTFRDWAAEQTSFPNFVAEMALAHIVKGVEGDYRRGDLFEKRRRLMDAWATYCTTKNARADVHPIRKKAAAPAA